MQSRIAKLSEDYIKESQNYPKHTKSERTAALNQIKNTAVDKAAAMNKIGQGFVGPVMMRLKYEGIARNVLTEDVIAIGDVPVYDVADEMGKAYFLQPYNSEIAVSQYEGKRVMYQFVHLAEFPTVQTQDMLELTIDMLDYAMNEARQRIQEKEDTYLITQLKTAAEAFTPSNPDFAGLTSHVVSASDSSGYFQFANFTNASRISAQNRLDSKNLLMNTADVYDLYSWDLTATSVNFKNEQFSSSEPITEFAGYRILKSVMMDKGTAFVLPDSDYIGRFPTRQSIQIQDNNKAENFAIGAIMDEFINEIILNTNGIVEIKKSS